MKHFFIAINEEFSEIPVRVSSSKKLSATILWEIVLSNSFSLNSYLKGLNNKSMAEALKTEPGYFRLLIYNHNSNLIVFVFCGDLLHNEVSFSISKNKMKMKIPNDVDYFKLYDRII